MKKELLTKETVKKDLLGVPAPCQTRPSVTDRCIPTFLLTVTLGGLCWRIWPFVSVVMFVIAAASVGLLVWENVQSKREAVAYVTALEAARVIVAVEELVSIRTETVSGYRHGKQYFHDETYFRFASGKQWTLPRYGKLYAWSESFSMSPKGVENTSICGDKFYFAELEGFPHKACVYNTKLFDYRE